MATSYTILIFCTLVPQFCDCATLLFVFKLSKGLNKPRKFTILEFQMPKSLRYFEKYAERQRLKYSTNIATIIPSYQLGQFGVQVNEGLVRQ